MTDTPENADTAPQIDVSVIHRDDGKTELALLSQDGSYGISAELTREQRYDIAEALLTPNGSGFMRSAGRMARLKLSPEEQKAREDAIQKSADRMRDTGTTEL